MPNKNDQANPAQSKGKEDKKGGPQGTDDATEAVDNAKEDAAEQKGK